MLTGVEVKKMRTPVARHPLSADELPPAPILNVAMNDGGFDLHG